MRVFVFVSVLTWHSCCESQCHTAGEARNTIIFQLYFPIVTDRVLSTGAAGGTTAMPELPEQRVGEQQHSPAALIYAALLHNKLSIEEGFGVFDQDQDSKLSFEDVRESCRLLELGVPDDAVRQFHQRATVGGEFLDLQGWKQVLSAPEGLDAVLELRGLNASELPPVTAALSVQEMLNIVKTALSYNSLTLEDGFHSFDVDQDGKISLPDLEAAVSQLQLGISVADVRILHAQFDHKRTDFVELVSWVTLLGSADGESILMSRGITTQQSMGTQGDSAFDTTGENTSRPIDVLAATLSYNSLCAADGYDAFDTDEDGKVLLNDLFFSVAHLQMDIADADVKTLFASLEDRTDAGFISKEAWVQAVTSANTSDILKSRGVSTAPVTLTESVQKALNTIAAALVFNNLNPEEGYDSFDADEDTRVSLSDLQSAVIQLQLDISEQDSKSLFESLDAGKTGFIPKEVWIEVMNRGRFEVARNGCS